MLNDEIIIDGKLFKQIKINKNYFVSREGKVYSIHSKKILKGSFRSRKNDLRPYVDITVNGKQKHINIQRLVVETWIRPLKIGEQINHRDNNPLNNSVENLYIGNQKENIKDCINSKRRIGNMFYLTVFDKEVNKVITFCPSNKFIKYSGHPNKSGNLNKFFSKNWFKKRYEIIEFKKVKNLEEFHNLNESVETMGDECSPVG